MDLTIFQREENKNGKQKKEEEKSIRMKKCKQKIKNGSTQLSRIIIWNGYLLQMFEWSYMEIASESFSLSPQSNSIWNW